PELPHALATPTVQLATGAHSAIRVVERPCSALEALDIFPLAFLPAVLMPERPVVLPVSMVERPARPNPAVRVALNPIGSENRDLQGQCEEENDRHEEEHANHNPYPTPNAEGTCQPPE